MPIRRIIFIWEIYLSLATLVPTAYMIFNISKDFTDSTFNFCLILLFYNKFRKEGLRINSMFLILGIILCCIPQKYCLISGSLLIIFCTIFFKSFIFPMDSSKYKIGYKVINFAFKEK